MHRSLRSFLMLLAFAAPALAAERATAVLRVEGMTLKVARP